MGQPVEIAAPPRVRPVHRPFPRPTPSRFEQAGIALSLLTLSALTTVSTGALLMFQFRRGVPPFASSASLFPFEWVVRNPDQVYGGWPFCVTLLGILTAHEIGHYLACRRHRVAASLPWVLPAPTLIGTFGGFIRLRSRLPSRVALLDIGVFGPLAGMVVAIPALIIGLVLSNASVPAEFHSGSISVTVPLLLSILHSAVRVFNPSLPPLDGSFNPHPVLVAGWIGLFITSVNLIPAGQLDGGHILYAISPRLHRWSTDAMILLLFIAGTVFWIGWLVWGCFLLIPALRHPRVPKEPQVTGWRLSLAAAALLLFALTFTLAPFAGGSLMDYLH